MAPELVYVRSLAQLSEWVGMEGPGSNEETQPEAVPLGQVSTLDCIYRWLKIARFSKDICPHVFQKVWEMSTVHIMEDDDDWEFVGQEVRDEVEVGLQLKAKLDLSLNEILSKAAPLTNGSV